MFLTGQLPKVGHMSALNLPGSCSVLLLLLFCYCYCYCYYCILVIIKSPIKTFIQIYTSLWLFFYWIILMPELLHQAIRLTFRLLPPLQPRKVSLPVFISIHSLAFFTLFTLLHVNVRAARTIATTNLDGHKNRNRLQSVTHVNSMRRPKSIKSETC